MDHRDCPDRISDTICDTDWQDVKCKKVTQGTLIDVRGEANIRNLHLRFLFFMNCSDS